MIGKLGRKYLNRLDTPAVGGLSVSATYVMSGWPHVDDLRLEQMTERLIGELVASSLHPGAGPASALGLIASEEHREKQIVMTFSLCDSGRDVGCH